MYRAWNLGAADDLNSATVNYYQQGEISIKSLLFMELLENFLNSHIFTALRTEKELGYVAFASRISHACVDGFIVSVGKMIYRRLTNKILWRIVFIIITISLL